MTDSKKGKKVISARKKDEPIRQHHYAAFDFETTGLDGDVVFGTLQTELTIQGERSEVFSVYGADSMLDEIRRLNMPRMRWFAHNLEFDAYFILRELQKRMQRGEVERVDLFERGMGKFYKICIAFSDGGSNVELYDSMALFGFSLSQFLKNFSAVGEKLSLDFETESFDGDNPDHIEYAKQDTRGLLDAMVNFDQAFYVGYGVHLKGTISSTALAAWEVTLKKEQIYKRLSAPQSDFARQAYFGGLVFLTSREIHTDVVSVDVNSMYPFCMRKYGVPVGVPGYSRKKVAGRPGIYRAIFSVPDELAFGCIGFRDRHGIAWPRGKFESVAFCFEIERAEKWGCSVEIIEGLVFDRCEFPFSDFVDKCEKARAENKGTPFEIVVKLAQNSVYGKFGTKTEGNEVALFADTVDIDSDWLPYIDETTGCNFFDGLMHRKTERDAYYMLPHWAAHITARARGELLDIVEACGGSAIYGDTDSVKMPRDIFDDLLASGRISVGAEYGQLKLDAEYGSFRAIAPKVYAHVSRGTYSGKGKGIPEKKRTADFWAAVYRGETPTVEFSLLQSLRSALKKDGVRKLNSTHRASTDLANSNSWYGDSFGGVKAVKIIDDKRVKE